MEYGAVDFAQEVANLDMDSLSPREALNLLYGRRSFLELMEKGEQEL